MEKATPTEYIKTPFQYEVIRNNRFRFEFPEEFDIQSWLIQSVSLPKFTKDEKGNFVEFKIKIIFINPIGPGADQKLIQNFIYDKKNNFDCKIFFCDPTGVDVGLWEIGINNVDSIDFGTLDYGDGSINNIEMILNVEKAILRY